MIDIDFDKIGRYSKAGPRYTSYPTAVEFNESDEVKKAYRAMAKKYHPDKLQSKDPALIKGAQEKFQEVQKAYETIQKAREMN